MIKSILTDEIYRRYTIRFPFFTLQQLSLVFHQYLRGIVVNRIISYLIYRILSILLNTPGNVPKGYRLLKSFPWTTNCIPVLLHEPYEVFLRSTHSLIFIPSIQTFFPYHTSLSKWGNLLTLLKGQPHPQCYPMHPEPFNQCDYI